MENSERTQEIIAALTKSYNMELETVMNYIAVSTILDRVRAKRSHEAHQR